jgi:hypothetical protein
VLSSRGPQQQGEQAALSVATTGKHAAAVTISAASAAGAAADGGGGCSYGLPPVSQEQFAAQFWYRELYLRVQQIEGNIAVLQSPQCL